MFAPQTQKILQFLNNTKPIPIKVFYEVFLSLITQIINIQQLQQQADDQQPIQPKASLKLILYDNNELQLIFPQLDNQIVDFIRRSTDGRVHFTKSFIQTHIYQQKFIQTSQLEALFGFQILQRKHDLKINPVKVSLHEFYKVKIFEDLKRYSIAKQEEDELTKQLDPFIKFIQKDIPIQNMPFKTFDFIAVPQINETKDNLILSVRNVNFNICTSYPPYYVTNNDMESCTKCFAQSRFPVLVSDNVYRSGKLIGSQKNVEDAFLSSNNKIQECQLYVVEAGSSGFLRSGRTVVVQLQLSYREICEDILQKSGVAMNATLEGLITKYLTAAQLLLRLRKQGPVLIAGTEERLVAPILLFLIDLLGGEIISPETFISYFDWHFVAFGYPVFSLYHSNLIQRIKKMLEPQVIPDGLQSDVIPLFLGLAVQYWILKSSPNVSISAHFGFQFFHELFSIKSSRYLFDTEAERIVSGVAGLVNNSINVQDVIGRVSQFYDENNNII